MIRNFFLFLTSLCLMGSNIQGQDSTALLEQELTQNPDPIKAAQIREKLWEAYINTDIEKAMEQALRIVAIGHELNSDTLLSSGYQTLGTTYAYLNQFDSSGHYFRKALVVYKKTNDIEGIAGTQRNLGQDFNMIGNFDSASHYFSLAGENYALIQDSVGMADIYNSEAIIYYIKGFYNLAFDKAVQGEEIFERRAGLDADLNQNRMVIAAIYADMKDTANATEYYRQILDYFKANNLTRQYVSNGILLSDLLIPNHNAHPELEVLIPELVELSTNLQDIALINHAQRAASELAYEQNNFEKAREIQLELVEKSQAEGQEYLLAENLLALGKTLLAVGDYKQAITQLKASIGLFSKLEMETLTRNAYKLLSESYERIGDYQNSLAAFRTFKALDEKIYTAERTNRFSELQTIYETEKKANSIALQREEIKTLQSQAETDRLVRMMYGMGLVSVLFILGLLVFSFRQRMQRHRAEREQQDIIHQKEIEYKQKELASQTLHLLQKHNYIKELKENLSAIKESPENLTSEIHRLGRLLDMQSSEDEKWEAFKTYFAEVHNDFDQQLQAVAPDISENDIRLAAFLRMNLTTKEIAALLNVQPESVMKSKYRLKKKLGLDKEQDLNVFLTNLTKKQLAVQVDGVEYLNRRKRTAPV